jgi:hypothetical protein
VKKEIIIIENDRVKEVKELSRLQGQIPPNKKHKSRKDYKRKSRWQLWKTFFVENW